jgi:hypothetical protein
MAQALVIGPSPPRPEFTTRSVHAGFVVDEVALGKIILRVLLFSLVSIIPPCFSTLIYNLVGEQ